MVLKKKFWSLLPTGKVKFPNLNFLIGKLGLTTFLFFVFIVMFYISLISFERKLDFTFYKKVHKFTYQCTIINHKLNINSKQDTEPVKGYLVFLVIFLLTQKLLYAKENINIFDT